MTIYHRIDSKILKLHRDAIVVDGHADTFHAVMSGNDPDVAKRTKKHTHPVIKSFFQRNKITSRAQQAITHADYHRLRQGGTDLQFMAIYTPSSLNGTEATAFAFRMLFEILQGVREGQGKVRLITKSEHLDLMAKERSMGFLIDIEGGNALNKDIGMLKVFYSLGARAMGLTHNPRNDLGDGVAVTNPRGLTAFGKQVVREINRLNMILDVVHLAKPGFRDLARIATGPIIASHTGIQSRRDIQRNMNDEQIREICKRKGVIGIMYLPEFIIGGRLSYKEIARQKLICTVGDVVDTIAYVADKYGVDYVGLGSDWDGYGGVTLGLEDASYVPNITDGLVKSGFNTAEIKKILGGNFIRVIRQVIG